MCQAKLVCSLAKYSYAQLREKFADAIARRDVNLAHACDVLLASSNAAGGRERAEALLEISPR